MKKTILPAKYVEMSLLHNNFHYYVIAIVTKEKTNFEVYREEDEESDDFWKSYDLDNDSDIEVNYVGEVLYNSEQGFDDPEEWTEDIIKEVIDHLLETLDDDESLYLF